MNSISLYHRTFLSEIIKSKKTLAVWISILGALLIILLVVCILWSEGEHIIKEGENPWAAYFGMSWQSVSTLLLPLYIILIAGLVVNTEHKAKSWKYIYSLPIPKWMVYYSKFQYLILLNFITHTLFFSFQILGGYFLSIVRPDLNFVNFSVPILGSLIITAKLFISTLGILSIQYVLSMLFKNLFVSLGIGLAFIISSLIIIQWKFSYTIPYLFPLNSVIDSINSIAGTSNNLQLLTRSELFSIVLFIITSFIGCFIVVNREVK